MNMIFLTMYVGMGLNTDLTKGVFDRLRSLPIARWAPLAGRISADLVKQAWSIVLLLVGGLHPRLPAGHEHVGAARRDRLLLLFALAFSWISVLVGVVAKDPEKVQVFGFTALFPVTFVSNVFVQTETMPGWLQPVVKANPVSILADAARGLHGRRPGGRAGDLVAALGGRHRAGLRPARGVPLQAPRLSSRAAGLRRTAPVSRRSSSTRLLVAQGGGEALEAVGLLAGRRRASGRAPAASRAHGTQNSSSVMRQTDGGTGINGSMNSAAVDGAEQREDAQRDRQEAQPGPAPPPQRDARSTTSPGRAVPGRGR